MKWTANEVRRTFLEFFKERGHVIVPSSSLLPKGDPTLLFTNAGMNQFKPYFLGEATPPFTRAASAQKCIRAGGKHNDLDNVGFTRRHHTFFEMLGNFSFGDYFKREAIQWAWELVTEVYGLPKERLWASVFRDDDEAYAIWRDVIGLPEERILRLGEKDNFWEMGDTGPCGPSSEIHYDLGPEMDPHQKSPAEEGERFLELWNLVFMQFNRKPDGSLEPLPKKNIDTGMGLERLLAVLQGVGSNFHTDLFMPLIEEVERITGVKYDPGPAGAPHRVLADHARALTFAIADGIYPSNYGRGYVLRRILRRAHRFAQKIGFEDKPVLYRLVPVVAEIMGDAYPEVRERQVEVEFIIKAEEERFVANIARNLPRLREALEAAKDHGILSGQEVFRFYDTYGLPLDLIEEYAAEYGIRLDWEGFERALDAQRERAKAAAAFKMELPEWTVLDPDYRKSEFLGYETTEAPGKLVKYGRLGGKLYVVLDRTPFYPEGGGQVGDRGILEGEIEGAAFLIEVEDTQRVGDDIVHIGSLKYGKLPQEAVEVYARVDPDHRKGAQRAHTGTHLLHAALREVLGEHARQEGSLVAPDRLRFDFVHFKALTREEIERIETIVNEKIRENIPLDIRWMPYREAAQQGAMALFEGKYGETVRVVTIGDFSKELCGGTHASRTGDIGILKIIKEEAISAGVRRIEALVGKRAEEYIRETEDNLLEVARILNTRPDRAVERAEKVTDQLKAIQQENSRLLDRLVALLAEKLSPQELGGVRVFVHRVSGLDAEGLRRLSDRLVERGGSRWVVFLGSEHKGRAFLFARVSPDLVDHISAAELLRVAGQHIQGGGGGSAEKAEGGGRSPGGLEQAIETARTLIAEKLKKGAPTAHRT